MAEESYRRGLLVLSALTGPLSDPLIFSSERNSSVELRCSVVSGSGLTFSWDRDGSALHNDTKYQLMEDYSTLTFTLTIRNLQKSDCGSYKCRVSNPVSVKESSYDLSSGKCLVFSSDKSFAKIHQRT
ncbi:HEPACAM family member 2-like [Cyprinus carpio]|uniref:HEPACAM family member 2-like n=1 Tax=Cyprinus carpio TaxID=7962 RepID=A0A9Q9WQY1_CYPCA|nr:HEPACAM family member 2-like [Cyprinus carpio]